MPVDIGTWAADVTIIRGEPSRAESSRAARRPFIPDPGHAGGGTEALSDCIQVTLNGEPRVIAPGSVAGLLASLCLDLRKVAVERNEAIVPRSLYDRTKLLPGDRLEIVHFIGGG